ESGFDVQASCATVSGRTPTESLNSQPLSQSSRPVESPDSYGLWARSIAASRCEPTESFVGKAVFNGHETWAVTRRWGFRETTVADRLWTDLLFPKRHPETDRAWGRGSLGNLGEQGVLWSVCRRRSLS
ncbi:MAG: hypothetical protein ACKO3P_08130, partial [Planctomycetaceae bacterium]